VELLNLLRPTVAVSVYIVFIAHALALHPHARQSLAAGKPGYRRAFVDEVRRFYPFFPSLMARVRQDFEWRGAVFRRGRRVLLDLYGTNHHPEWWEQPEAFRPERFLGLAPNPWSFIPQGGGVHAGGHRCPGEWITIALMEAATGLLAGRMLYDLPAQDVSLDFGRMPALPKRGLMMRVKGMR
jgi:fatty-acid peroxygenase